MRFNFPWQEWGACGVRSGVHRGSRWHPIHPEHSQEGKLHVQVSQVYGHDRRIPKSLFGQFIIFQINSRKSRNMLTKTKKLKLLHCHPWISFVHSFIDSFIYTFFSYVHFFRTHFFSYAYFFVKKIEFLIYTINVSTQMSHWHLYYKL